MTTKKWDGADFRQRMLAKSQNAQNYANEHRARVRRGQSNGNLSVAEEYEGVSVICDTLSICADASSPTALMTLLDWHAQALESFDKNENYRRGYRNAIREIRAAVERFLQPS